LIHCSFSLFTLSYSGKGVGRVKSVSHVAIINWIKEVGELLPDAYEPETIPQVGELDELETFVGCKKTRFGSGQR
jgi:hypothetical protein